jgi:hypothetical protein
MLAIPNWKDCRERRPNEADLRSSACRCGDHPPCFAGIDVDGGVGVEEPAQDAIFMVLIMMGSSFLRRFHSK